MVEKGAQLNLIWPFASKASLALLRLQVLLPLGV